MEFSLLVQLVLVRLVYELAAVKVSSGFANANPETRELP